MPQAPKRLAKLKSLNVSGTNIGPGGAQAISELTGLTHLDISHNNSALMELRLLARSKRLNT